VWSDDDREAIENCLGRIGVAGCEIEDRVAGLTTIAFEYRCRRERRNKSPRIGDVPGVSDVRGVSASSLGSAVRAAPDDLFLSLPVLVSVTAAGIAAFH